LIKIKDMQQSIITFNDVPQVLMEMKHKIDFICSQLPKEKEQNEDKLMPIEQLMNYVPGKPAKQTIYGWINNRLIPFEKHGRRLYFRKSEIETWLNNGRKVK
jgi:excisionase family DNA binding protein